MDDKLTAYETDLALLDAIFERWQRGEATVEADLPFLLGFARGQAARIRDLEARSIMFSYHVAPFDKPLLPDKETPDAKD